jgi:hypothetical protein
MDMDILGLLGFFLPSKRGYPYLVVVPKSKEEDWTCIEINAL